MDRSKRSKTVAESDHMNTGHCYVCYVCYGPYARTGARPILGSVAALVLVPPAGPTARPTGRFDCESHGRAASGTSFGRIAGAAPPRCRQRRRESPTTRVNSRGDSWSPNGLPAVVGGVGRTVRAFCGQRRTRRRDWAEISGLGTPAADFRFSLRRSRLSCGSGERNRPFSAGETPPERRKW